MGGLRLHVINRLAGGEDPSASPFLCPGPISSPLPQPGYATRLCMLGADFLAYFIQGSILESLPLHKRNGMDFDLKLRWMSRRSPSKAMETMFAAEDRNRNPGASVLRRRQSGRYNPRRSGSTRDLHSQYPVYSSLYSAW